MLAQKQQKRKYCGRVKVACQNCKRSKRCCDNARPCSRCRRLGFEDCMDAERKDKTNAQEEQDYKLQKRQYPTSQDSETKPPLKKLKQKKDKNSVPKMETRFHRQMASELNSSLGRLLRFEEDEELAGVVSEKRFFFEEYEPPQVMPNPTPQQEYLLAASNGNSQTNIHIMEPHPHPPQFPSMNTFSSASFSSYGPLSHFTNYNHGPTQLPPLPSISHLVAPLPHFGTHLHGMGPYQGLSAHHPQLPYSIQLPGTPSGSSNVTFSHFLEAAMYELSQIKGEPPVHKQDPLISDSNGLLSIPNNNIV